MSMDTDLVIFVDEETFQITLDDDGVTVTIEAVGLTERALAEAAQHAAEDAAAQVSAAVIAAAGYLATIQSLLAKLALFVDNFGAVPDGETDSASQFRAASVAAIAAGAKLILSPGEYIIHDGYNLTNLGNLIIEGSGQFSTILFITGAPENMVDMTGTSNVHHRDLTVEGEGANFGILLATSTTFANNVNTWTNCNIEVRVKKAVVEIFNSTDGMFDHCKLSNTDPDCKYVLHVTATNELGAFSAFTDISTEAPAQSGEWVFDQLEVHDIVAGVSTCIPIKVSGSFSPLKFIGGVAAGSTSGSVGGLVTIDGTDTHGVSILGMELYADNSVSPDCDFRINGDVEGLVIDDCSGHGTQAFVSLANGVTLSDARITSNRMGAGAYAIRTAGSGSNVTRSVIDAYNRPVNLGSGTLSQSVVVGASTFVGVKSNSLVTGVPTPPSDGGTGISNNNASTITITGSFGIAISVSAPASITLPQSLAFSGNFNYVGGGGSMTQRTSGPADWTFATGTFNAAALENNLGAFASTTSAQLLAKISDAVGTGALVFKSYADGLIASADAMVFKGVIDCSANPNYPAADAGWTYRVSVAGKIGGASGVNVEIGDLLLCITDGTASGNQATVGSHWSIGQTNIDGAVVGPTSATDSAIALFDGATGKLIKNSGVLLNTLATLTGAEALTNKSINGLTITSTTGTLTIANGKTVVFSNGITFTGTDGTTMTTPGASASLGYLNVPQNSQSAAYTTVLADAGKHIYHPAGDANARTFTIDSNSNVAYPIGTTLTFVNRTAQVVTIACGDTMTLAGTTTTGSRSLAQNGVATAIKDTATTWIISGTGLS